MRILLVEDAKRLRLYITRALMESGYAVDSTSDGEEALAFAGSYDYDVIVLDLMLPRVDGFSVLRELRELRNKALVLILSAKDTVGDRVKGLRSGADDYLIKPFALEELEARIQALIRRRYDFESPQVEIGGLVIDTAKRVVLQNDNIIDLKPREYSLLEFLAMKKGRVVSRSEIENHIYSERTELSSNAVDAAICRLRRKIDRGKGPSLITTRRGMGYVLEEAAS